MAHTHAVLEQLKRLRKTRKQTQAALASRIGILRGTYSRAESGAADASLSTIAAMANALDAELVVVPRAQMRDVELVMQTNGRYLVVPPGVSAPLSRVR